MMNILSKIKINNYTYLFILICFLCGYFKNIMIIMFICIFHELGHIFWAKIFRYKIIHIEIFPFGGFTTIDKKINSSINKDIVISLGGILFQIILLLIIYIFKKDININTYQFFYKYNIIILLFNLIPVVPLDGNNILHFILEKKLPYSSAYKINGIISIIVLILFISVNIIYNYDNYLILSFLVYKIYLYIKNYKYLKNRFLIERLLYNIDYYKIDNNTRNINELKKEVFHYFKYNNKYINERKIIENNYLNKNMV